MPFTNLSSQPENAFFADGLHEEILSTLAGQIPGIAVISRTTMMSYRQAPKPLSEVAQELGATHVMEGTVRRESDHVRLTLQLVDAGTDRYLWTRSYDRTLASAMTLQSEVAADVATQMSVQLAQGAAPAMTRDPQAHDLYLQALLIFRDLGIGADLTTRGPLVEDLLTRALARDPDFALAYAQRARLYTLWLISGVDVSDKNYRSIITDLDAAERLASHDPIVLGARAYFLMVDEQIDRGLEVMQAAEDAGLNDAAFLVPKTRMLLERGRVDDLIRTHERMLSLDPANPLVFAFGAEHLLYSQRTDLAWRTIVMARTRVPEVSNYFEGYIRFVSAGDVSAYRKVVEPWMSAPEGFGVHAQVLRGEHRYAEMVDFLSHYTSPSVRYGGGSNEGQVFKALGERPVAEQLGWAYLLLNDRPHAQEQGHAVLAFAAKQKPTKWNGYYLRLLEAQGYTFTGQRSEALTAAHAALRAMPKTRNALTWVGVASVSARVLAWNGAGDEAVKLLQELTSSAPGLQPGLVAREPLFTVPLANHPQFRSLLVKLEEQMRHAPLQ
jgi:TolB-like protein